MGSLRIEPRHGVSLASLKSATHHHQGRIGDGRDNDLQISGQLAEEGVFKVLGLVGKGDLTGAERPRRSDG